MKLTTHTTHVAVLFSPAYQALMNFVKTEGPNFKNLQITLDDNQPNPRSKLHNLEIGELRDDMVYPWDNKIAFHENTVILHDMLEIGMEDVGSEHLMDAGEYPVEQFINELRQVLKSFDADPSGGLADQDDSGWDDEDNEWDD
jgi:hypothetical protein